MAEQDYFSKQPRGGIAGKRIIYIIAAAALLIAAIAGYAAYRHNSHVNYLVESIAEEVSDAADGYYLEYPGIEADDLYWGEGGWYEQVRDNKKLAQALTAKMWEKATTTKEDGAIEISTAKLQTPYRMAAVLEYLGYESQEVKDCLAEITAQSLEKIRSSEYAVTLTSGYETLLRFEGLGYYDCAKQAISHQEVEQYLAERWQKLKGEMGSGKEDLEDLLEDVYSLAFVQPIQVPARQTAGTGTETASAANGVALKKPLLDMDKIIPYGELTAALQANGEQAIFHSGQGGYYDGQSGKGTFYGDFQRLVISGRVRRTGQEDAFTEQYLRENYDKPDSTKYYFKDEQISPLPPFFNDTRQVYVYNGSAYAFTDYAVYMGSTALIYDFDQAKEQEFKHISMDQLSYVGYTVDQVMAGMLRELREFNPRYQFDEENNLVMLYLDALPGTTEALKAGQPVPVSSDGRTFSWEDLKEQLTGMGEAMYDELKGNGLGTGLGLILISDVNQDAGLLSILNNEIIVDNNANPPEPNPPENTPESQAQ